MNDVHSASELRNMLHIENDIYFCATMKQIMMVRERDNNNNKKAVLPQGNRAMPQVFFSVEVRQQHSLQV